MKENIENNEELENLKEELRESGIDISQYGKDGAKRVEDLLKEIQDKEASLILDEKENLIRKVSVGTVNIFYTSPKGEKYILKEEKQVFKDGRKRERKNLDTSVAGKIKADEDPEEAIIREIQEELGIFTKVDVFEEDFKTERVISPSYPGLMTEYVMYKFSANIEEDDYKPEGYIEKTDTLDTYFVWKKL